MNRMRNRCNRGLCEGLCYGPVDVIRTRYFPKGVLYYDVVVNKSVPLVVPLLFSPISHLKAAVMLRPICLPSAPPDVASEQT